MNQSSKKQMTDKSPKVVDKYDNYGWDRETKEATNVAEVLTAGSVQFNDPEIVPFSWQVVIKVS